MTITTNPVAIAGNRAVPSSVDPGPDLGRKPDDSAHNWTDSIYVTGMVQAGDQAVSYLVHVARQPARGVVVQSVSVTEQTQGRFHHHQELFALDAARWAESGLDLSTSSLEWTGDHRRQHLNMTFPFGSLDLAFDIRGPVLYYGGTGSWPMLGFQQWQYALTGIDTVGTLTLDGVAHDVTGESWLDRQWGDLPDLDVNRWTWFNIALPGGEKLAVWDVQPAGDDTGEQSWATMVHPDGSHELLAVVPLADGAGQEWTSPATGKRYPTRWTISVPARDILLHVTSDVLEQELPALGGGIYEGLATVTGSYGGRQVDTKSYVEQVGSWRA